MLFNFIKFLYFFVVGETLYFSLPHKFRWILLLASSWCFYTGSIPILILECAIVINYFTGTFLENHSGNRKKWDLIVSLTANLSLLAILKYFNFANGALRSIFQDFGPINCPKLKNSSAYLFVVSHLSD